MITIWEITIPKTESVFNFIFMWDTNDHVQVEIPVLHLHPLHPLPQRLCQSSYWVKWHWLPNSILKWGSLDIAAHLNLRVKQTTVQHTEVVWQWQVFDNLGMKRFHSSYFIVLRTKSQTVTLRGEIKKQTTGVILDVVVPNLNLVITLPWMWQWTFHFPDICCQVRTYIESKSTKSDRTRSNV